MGEFGGGVGVEVGSRIDFKSSTRFSIVKGPARKTGLCRGLMIGKLVEFSIVLISLCELVGWESLPGGDTLPVGRI